MKLRLLTGALALATMQLGNAHAQTLAPVATDSAASTAEEIVVLGQGVRQTQTLTGEELLRDAPGTSPLKLVERLPGVSYTAADAFGAYEWAVRINIRGFQQQQLGFTVDGIPLGDMSYGNFNGLHISRAAISENIQDVQLSQGAGVLGTHSTSNLGGTLQFTTRRASEERGGVLAFSGGSDSLFRGYGRLETGAIDALGGARGYVSYVHNEQDKWKNGGQQIVDQWNTGFTVPLPLGEIEGYYNHSERREADYQDLSLEMIQRLGPGWDNTAPNWALANLIADVANNRGDTGLAPTNPAAGTVYPAPIATVDDAYYDASGLRDDDLARLTYKADIGENVAFSASMYHHEQEGQGTWFTPYANPFSFGLGTVGVTSPVSVRTTEYDMVRLGGFADLSVTIGAHTVQGGFWLEHNSFDQARRFYANTRAAPRDVMNFMRNPFATQWAFDYEIDTQVFYVQDTWDVTDALTVQGGFKSLKVENSVVTVANGFAGFTPGSDADLRGTITAEDNFLPQVGFTYQLNEAAQLFGGYTENMRAFDLAAFNNRSQISFDAVKRLTDPETSKTIEGGARLRGDRFQAVGAVYFVKFDNRLLGIRQGAGIIGNPSVISNVGGVETKGIELAVTYDVTDNWTAFASYAYNDSTYEDNVVDATGAILQRTAGATVVNTPEHLFKTDLSYDNGSLFGNISASYTGERQQDYTNATGQVDGFTVVDMSAGYRFEGEGPIGGLELRLNVTNLLDEDYVSTIGTNGFTSGNAFFNQSLMVGAPRQVFVTVRKTF